MPVPEVTPEIERTLSRYLEIQQEEHRLAVEKERLQQALIAHLAGMTGTYWRVVVGGQPVKVRYRREVQVLYDEELLRKRLGERYVRLLKPDLAKLRRHLPEIERHLAPVLTLVGSPSPDRVRAAVSQGLVAQEEFSGAFTKQVKCTIAVMRARDEVQRTADQPW